MWVAKFKIKHDTCWITPKTAKYNVSSFGIPLSAYTKNGKKYHTGVDFLQGSEQEKKKLLAAIKRDKHVKEMTVQGDQVFVLIEGEDFITNHYDPALFFVSPVFTSKGHEYWELGSWERERLLTFYDNIKTKMNVELLKIQNEVPQLFIHQALPTLTPKQKDVFKLARDLGYYNHPRKISVEELAKRCKIPRSTFQEHLRKAENRIMEMVGKGIGL